MRILFAVPALALLACTPMKTIDGSARRYLTQAGTTIAFNKPAADVTAAVEVYFQERGLPVFNRATVSDTNRVLFFKGPRQRRGGRSSGFVADGIGSWFAVRVLAEGNKTTLHFYGKPTFNDAESCGEGDRELKDTGYTCTAIEQRADWPGHQLVEGREETQVISTVIARLGERWPLD